MITPFKFPQIHPSISARILPLFLALVLVLGLSLNRSQAQGDGIGVGIIAGEPTGISAKFWISQKSALDAALAWSFVEGGFFHVHADYILHSFELLPVSKGQLPVYYGAGGKARFGETRTEIGLRIPVGLAYLFEDAPFDIFLEIVPGLNLSPTTQLDIEGAVGFRFFFN